MGNVGPLGRPRLVVQEIFDHLLPVRKEVIDEGRREPEASDPVDRVGFALAHVHEAERRGLTSRPPPISTSLFSR